MIEPTILVVDDELFFRRLYAELLSENGYQVKTAATGDEAREFLQQGGIDIVLTDLVMPGLDGMDVLRLSRNLDPPPDVILATGHATLETAIQALKNGARDYLIKPFNPDELRHLVRTCVEQRRVLDENTLLKSQIRLFQKGQNLASSLDVEKLLPLAVNTLVREIGAGRGFAFLVDKDSPARLFGLNGVEETEGMALARALVPHLADLSGIRLLRASELPPTENGPPEVQTVCLFPLHCQKKLKGAMVVCNPPGIDFPHPLPHESLLFLSEQTSLGFENAFRYQGAQELIYTDDLTGLYNHRYLQKCIEQEVRRSERYGLEFSVAFIDLDNFKDINDAHGHLAGSQALKEVADLLRQSVREVDVLFRYGGDEFTAMLVETDSRGAAIVADRIRRTIENHPLLADTGSPVKVTATVGYATFPLNASDKNGLIDLADRAMYEGKKVRNVVRGAWEQG